MSQVSYEGGLLSVFSPWQLEVLGEKSCSVVISWYYPVLWVMLGCKCLWCSFAAVWPHDNGVQAPDPAVSTAARSSAHYLQPRGRGQGNGQGQPLPGQPDQWCTASDHRGTRTNSDSFIKKSTFSQIKPKTLFDLFIDWLCGWYISWIIESINQRQISKSFHRVHSWVRLVYQRVNESVNDLINQSVDTSVNQWLS